MAFGDPLQWVILFGALVLGVLVVLVIAYILLRILRTLDKADRYFDSKAKGSGQPASASANHMFDTSRTTRTVLKNRTLNPKKLPYEV